jgi:hypothetical protein
MDWKMASPKERWTVVWTESQSDLERELLKDPCREMAEQTAPLMAS